LFEDIIRGYTGDGLPLYMMRLWKDGSPEDHAYFRVYSGSSAGHAGTTAGYSIHANHYSSNFSSGNNFADGNSVIASFTPMPKKDQLNVPDGGDNTPSAVFNYRWLTLDEDDEDHNYLNDYDPSENWLLHDTAPANRRSQGIMWGREYHSVGPTAGVAWGSAFAEDTNVTCSPPYFSGMTFSHFRMQRYDIDGKDVAQVLSGSPPQSLPDLSSIGDVTCRISHYSEAVSHPEGKEVILPSEIVPGNQLTDSYIEFTGLTIDYAGSDNTELGITIGTVVRVSHPITSGMTYSSGSNPSLHEGCDITWGSIAEYWATLNSKTPSGSYGTDGPGHDDGLARELPVRVWFASQSDFQFRSATNNTGVIHSDGTKYTNDASLTHLSDVSDSLSSQISAAQSNPKGDVSDSLVIKYNSATSKWEAIEGGIESRDTISFRIESDVPITTGNNKILRTIPFESRIDAMTLVVPDGVATMSVELGIDKYSPGSSFPTTSGVLTDMDGSSTYAPTIRWSDGNTYYLGITSGGIEKGIGGWSDSGLSAGDILAINVDANLANVNTILGDIVLKRLS
jgi:hypothetical protein